jgi:ribosomal protein S18 acetylase RimI-like enzyme
MDVKIRPATLADLTQIQQLNQEVFEHDHKYDDDLVMDWALGPHGEAYFRSVFANEYAIILVAEEAEKLVGYASCGLKKVSYRKSRYLEIENIGVIPTHRSNGIGNMLLQEAKEWARKHGFDRLFVNSYFHNDGAIRFYKRFGFEPIDICLEMKI